MKSSSPKRKTILLSVALLIFAIISTEFVLSFIRGAGVFYYYPSVSGELDEVFVDIGDKNVILFTGRSDIGGKNMLVFEAAGPGETDVSIKAISKDHPGEILDLTDPPIHFFVTAKKMIYTDYFDFSSYRVISTYFALCFAAAAATLYVMYRKKLKSSPYSHRTILYLGIALFCLLNAVLLGAFSLSSMIRPENYSSISLFMYSGEMLTLAVVLSFPLILIFSLFMIASNISLIRHEGYRFSNLLGFIISFLLIAGSLSCVILSNLIQIGVGEDLRDIPLSSLISFADTALIYFECHLIATMHCMFRQVRTEPERDADFIIILGCKVNKDGSLLPLVRGRVDRAIAFYRKQLEETGKNLCFIPSGGQGSDETLPEGRAMANYLISEGIDEELVIPETASATTFENMKFSKKIIDSKKENAKVVFSTTNYHLFRAGVFSEEAGLDARGIGAKTKWYF